MTPDPLTTATAVGCAGVGGVFFAFSTFVMPALSRLPDDLGATAMRSINITAVRLAFMALLFGTAALCLATGVRAVGDGLDGRSVLLLVGCAAYLLGTIVVTIAYHVPRNDALAAQDPSAPGAAAAWRTYVSEWTAMNHVRTLAAFAAAVLLLVAGSAPAQADASPERPSLVQQP